MGYYFTQLFYKFLGNYDLFGEKKKKLAKAESFFKRFKNLKTEKP